MTCEEAMPENYLEPEYEPAYTAWKKSPGPAETSALLDNLHPSIEGAVRTHTGNVDPLLLSRGRAMALRAVRSYDPRRSRLQTHIYNQLQGLKRVAGQQGQVVRVPERIALDRRHLDEHEASLAAELGREPSDAELADRSGVSLRRLRRVRTYHPAAAEGAFGPEADLATDAPGRSPWTTAHQMVYDDLAPMDQKIMEYTFGLGGRKPLANQEIARRLKRTPGAISQRKAVIQRLLDEGASLGSFF
jgi:RNA polymerase primary sigma factor